MKPTDDYIRWVRAGGVCENCKQKNVLRISRNGKSAKRKPLKIVKLDPAKGRDPLNLMALCQPCLRIFEWDRYVKERNRKQAELEDQKPDQKSLFA